MVVKYLYNLTQLALICCAISSCNFWESHNNYEFLLESYPANKSELNDLLHFYKRTEGEKKVIFEYILDNLPFQFQSKFYLSRDLEEGGFDKIQISDGIDINEIENKIAAGYYIKSDTIFDINIFNAKDLIEKVESQYSLWQLKGKQNYMYLNDYLNNVIAYRLNNEEMDGIERLVDDRYPFDALLKIENESDTIAGMVNLLSNTVNNFSKDLKGVNFFNSPSYFARFFNNGRIYDYEDHHILRAKLLRANGIACSIIYSPSSRHAGTSSYSLKVTPSVDTPSEQVQKKKGISKIYKSTFLYYEWNNPYDELLRLGVERKNIPISLFVPKMKDVTSEFVISSDIVIQIPDSLMNKNVLYLSTYTSGKWKPVSWSAINRTDKSITFKDMGVEMLYQVTDYKAGVIQTCGNPFVLDSSGSINYMDNNGNTLVGYNLTEIQRNEKVKININYNLYQLTQGKWQLLQDAMVVSSDNDFLRIENIDSSGVYILMKDSISQADHANYRVFTLDEEGQIWW